MGVFNFESINIGYNIIKSKYITIIIDIYFLNIKKLLFLFLRIFVKCLIVISKLGHLH